MTFDLEWPLGVIWKSRKARSIPATAGLLVLLVTEHSVVLMYMCVCCVTIAAERICCTGQSDTVPTEVRLWWEVAQCNQTCCTSHDCNSYSAAARAFSCLTVLDAKTNAGFNDALQSTGIVIPAFSESAYQFSCWLVQLINTLCS